MSRTSLEAARVDVSERKAASHLLLPHARWLWASLGLALAALSAGLGAYHWFVYAPHPDRPHSYTIFDRVFDIGLASAILLCGALIGVRLLKLLPLPSLFEPLETIALATGLGLGTLSIGVLALGGIHLYYPATFAILLLTIPLLLRRDVRALAHQGVELARAARRGMRFDVARSVDVVEALPRMALAAVYVASLGFTLVLDMTPPTTQGGYDTYQYHWAVPLLLMRSHGWQAFPGWAHANLPFNSEMLNLIALALRAPEAATLVQDAFGVLSALLIFALVRRYFGSTPAWLAIVALATVPLLVVYGSQSLVESALIFYGVAVFTILVRLIEHVAAKQEIEYTLPALAGVFLGLALGVKYMALEFVPGALLMLGLGVAIRALACRGQGGWRFVGARALKAGVAFGAAAAIALGPWLVKDWLLLGNPVYPALAGVFGAPVWDPARDQMLQDTFRHFGPPPGVVERFHLFAIDLFVHPWRYGESFDLPMGRAAAASALAAPYFAVVLGRFWLWKRRVEGRQALFVLALTVTMALAFAVWSYSGALVERYALPPVVLASVLGATLVGWLIVRIPRRLFPVSWILLLVVAGICVGQNLDLYRLNYEARNPMPLLAGKTSEQAFMRTHLSQGVSSGFWQATDYVNSTLPHDGKLLMLGRGTGYFFTGRDYVADTGGDWVPYIVGEGKTPTGMLSILRAQRFTYVVYDGDLMYWLTNIYENRVLASQLPAYLAFQARELELVGQWGNVSLYRVPPPDNAVASSAVSTPPR